MESRDESAGSCFSSSSSTKIRSDDDGLLSQEDKDDLLQQSGAGKGDTVSWWRQLAVLTEVLESLVKVGLFIVPLSVDDLSFAGEPKL